MGHRQALAAVALLALLLPLPVCGDAAGRAPVSGRELPLHPYGEPVRPNAGPPAAPSLPLSTWAIDVVDPSQTSYLETSIALDSHGLPHVAYRSFMLRYAYHDGTSWHYETIENEGNTGYYPSLALDADDHPHIAYNAWYPYYDLRYIYFDGTRWHTQTIDHTGELFGYASLALDAQGYPHVSYCYGTTHDLRYASFDGTRWHTETVDTFGDVGGYTSLKLDSKGNPHIGYCEWPSGSYWFCRRLKYAHYDGHSWRKVYVDNAYTGDWLSMDLDSAERAHFSFYNAGNGTLMYAYPSGAGAFSWEVETVDVSGDLGIGGYTSLALDAADRPHISYCRWTQGFFDCGALRYARFDGDLWMLESVEEGGKVGYNSSMVLDSAGNPHIVYGCRPYLHWSGLRYATICVPLRGVGISGPESAPMGIPITYTAVYSPALATPPTATAWDNGASGPEAAYTWPATGTYTLAVSATGRCGGQAQDTFTVTVFCQEAASVEVAGPWGLLAGEVATYTAATLPITSSPPFTFTWDNGALGRSAAYSWDQAGRYTVTVTATNPCGAATGRKAVRVWDAWPGRAYLPLAESARR